MLKPLTFDAKAQSCSVRDGRLMTKCEVWHKQERVSANLKKKKKEESMLPFVEEQKFGLTIAYF